MLAGPDDGVLLTRTKKHENSMWVFLAKMLPYFLKSEILYEDQIDRLLCSGNNGIEGSFDGLGINPKPLEETKTVCNRNMIVV